MHLVPSRWLQTFAVTLSFLSIDLPYSIALDQEIATRRNPNKSSTTLKEQYVAPNENKENQSELDVEVEMFAALDSGEIKIDYYPKDASRATLVFHNQTKKPLKIKLAETFGALPVLAQGLGGGGGAIGGIGGGGGGGGQAGGGGLGGGGGIGGGGAGGGGGGLFRVDVDKPRKIVAATVCLEEGKPDPNPRMKYRIVRLEEVNPSPEIAEVCKELGYGTISQTTAQAAAWHLANGLTWDKLSSLPRKISRYTGTEYYFSGHDIQAAKKVVSSAKIATSNQFDSNSLQSSSEGLLKSEKY